MTTRRNPRSPIDRDALLRLTVGTQAGRDAVTDALNATAAAVDDAARRLSEAEDLTHTLAKVWIVQQLRDELRTLLEWYVGEGRAESITWANLGLAVGMEPPNMHTTYPSAPQVAQGRAQVRETGAPVWVTVRGRRLELLPDEDARSVPRTEQAQG